MWRDYFVYAESNQIDEEEEEGRICTAASHKDTD